MGRMVRKQLYIDASQEALLKARASAQGVSESDLMREALDALLSGTTSSRSADRRWRTLMSFAEERRVTVPEAPRTWTREDAHERNAPRGR